jgi:hypothetical protein
MTVDLAICFSVLIRTRHLIQSAMMLEPLSRETVFCYEESVITATHCDAIACLPSDQVNGSPAVAVQSRKMYVTSQLLIVQNSLTSNTKYGEPTIQKYRCHTLFKGTDLTRRVYIEYRGTNSGHEPQVVQERPVIWSSYTVNSFTHSPTRSTCKNDVESPISTTMLHHVNIKFKLHLF